MSLKPNPQANPDASLRPISILAGVITISDRASQGVYEDSGGPAVKTAAAGYGWVVVAETIVPDEKAAIQNRPPSSIKLLPSERSANLKIISSTMPVRSYQTIDLQYLP